jgi:hypothetical protein
MRVFNLVTTTQTPHWAQETLSLGSTQQEAEASCLSYLQPTNAGVTMHGMVTSHFVVWRLGTGTTVRLFYFLQQQDKKTEKEEANNKQKKNSQKDIRGSNRRLR